MQKKKYSKPVLEVEYYSLETTVAACSSTSSSSAAAASQTEEDQLGFSTYAVYGDNCGCYYSAGYPVSVANSLS